MVVRETATHEREFPLFALVTCGLVWLRVCSLGRLLCRLLLVCRWLGGRSRSRRWLVGDIAVGSLVLNPLPFLARDHLVLDDL